MKFIPQFIAAGNKGIPKGYVWLAILTIIGFGFPGKTDGLARISFGQAYDAQLIKPFCPGFIGNGSHPLRPLQVIGSLFEIVPADKKHGQVMGRFGIGLYFEKFFSSSYIKIRLLASCTCIIVDHFFKQTRIRTRFAQSVFRNKDPDLYRRVYLLSVSSHPWRLLRSFLAGTASFHVDLRAR